MHTYRPFLICALLSVWMTCATTFSARAQTAALRLSTQLDCASGHYLATLQIRASDATSFSIGTSSVFLTYDPSSLTFVGYQSLNFDTATLCGGQSLWESHSFDGLSPGLFNLTLVLNSTTMSCPLLSNSNWVDIGTITFGVRNPDGNPSLQFSTAFTSFNAVPANNGVIQIQQGQYVGVDQSGVLHCSPVCSISATATPGLCQPATNQYTLTGMASLSNAAAGSLIITDGSVSTTLSVAANQSTASFSLTGLVSNGLVHTLSASLSGCGSSSTTYTAPTSCSVAPVCSISAVATAGLCTAISNTYSASVVVRLTNPIAGILTITTGAQSQTFITTAGSSVSFTASFGGLLADGLSHTVTASLPGCSTTSTNYTAPTSCSIAPVCSVSEIVTAGSCLSATNTYSTTVIVTLTNATAAGILTIIDGPQSVTLATSPNSTTSYTAIFTGLSSDGSTHTVTASLPGCSTATKTYTSPGSCLQPTNSQLVLEDFVDKSKAKSGDVLTYMLVLTNTGTTTAANVIVLDSLMNGLHYLTNSATAPIGTTFTQGTPTSSWKVMSLTAGQSLSMTFQAIADSSGILYNKATIPGDTAIACTSVPIIVCTGDMYLFQLTAASGRSSYKWFKDNIELVGQTTNVLNVTAPGTYSLAVDNVSGKCPDFSCCPFIVEEDTLPSFQAVAVPVTCVGNVAQANGKLVVSAFKATYTYQYSLGANFNEAASLSGSPKLIPTDGVVVNNLPNQAVGQPYTIRVYNASGCYTDTTVLLLPCVCGCQEHLCVPFITQQTKRAIRIGDPR